MPDSFYLNIMETIKNEKLNHNRHKEYTNFHKENPFVNLVKIFV